MDSVFLQIGVVIITAAGCGILARLLRQPILLGYIMAGILLGAGGLHVIQDVTITQEVASIGIVFLLFLVGLELDVAKVRELGKVILVAGLTQLIVVTASGFAITQALGYSDVTSFYLGLAAAFSSTAVVLKRLTDRRDMASLYGKVTIGILLLQDMVAILALMVISGLGSEQSGSVTALLFVVKGALLLGGTWLLSKYVLAKIFYHVAKSTELLFLTSIAWAFSYAFLAEALGFSAEIGAFLAGLSLATLPYNLEIIGRVKPLKDFFLVIFFVVLGLEVSIGSILGNLPVIIGLTVVVLFVKSFVTSLAMVRLGYPKHPAYMTGSVLGQMSEFSLLLALMGLSQGHISQEIVAIIASLMVASIILNTYWNDLNKLIYPILSKPLQALGAPVKARELRAEARHLEEHVLLFGANRVGFQLLNTLQKLGRNVLVVDHNPAVIKRLQRKGVTCVYGDIDDLELLEEMGLDAASMVISTVPNTAASLYLVQQTRRSNHGALIITTGEQIEEALDMYAAGADYVILPRLVGGEQAAKLLENLEEGALVKESLRAEKTAHVNDLQARLRELSV